MNLIEYPDRATLMTKVAQDLAAALKTALSQRDIVSFAVPGGTTPGPVFDALAMTDLDWARVHVLLTDERWVPETDALSNAALVRARLLTGPAAAARFTPYFRADVPIDIAAQTLSAQVAPLLPLDLVLLGMGADMHTASLFPGALGLAEALAPDAPVFAPITVADQSTQRFTLTAPVLQRARATHILITGDDKRAALVRAQALPAAQAPVQTVLENATVHWSAT